MKIGLLVLLSLLTQISTFLFGKFDFLLLSVLFLLVINYLLALFLDFKNKTISKRNLLLRFFKIIGYLTFITISVILDNILKMNTIRHLVLMTFLYNEIVNIIKISISLGIKVPNIIVSSLQELVKNLPTSLETNNSNEENK